MAARPRVPGPSPDPDDQDTGTPAPPEQDEPAAPASGEPALIEAGEPATVEAGEPAAVEAGEPAAIEAGEPEAGEPAAVGAGEPVAAVAGDPVAVDGDQTPPTPEVGEPDTASTVIMPRIVDDAVQEPTVLLPALAGPGAEPRTVIMAPVPPAEDDPARPRTPVTELAREAARRRGRKPLPRTPTVAGGTRRAAAGQPRRLGARLAALDGRVLPPIADALVGLGRGARRARAVTAVAALVCFGLALVAVYTVARTPPVTGPPAIGTPSAAPGLRVGVKDGDLMPKYLAAAKQRLRQAQSGPAGVDRFALVSFTTYLTPAATAAALRGVHTFSVFMRVNVAGAPSKNAEVDNNLPAGIQNVMFDESAKDQQEVTDNEARLLLVPSGAPESAKLRDTYRTAVRLAQAEYDQYRGGACGCVYAAVIQATPAVLAAVAGRPGVRAVDVVPAESDPDLAVFTPPVPGQSGVVTLPPS